MPTVHALQEMLAAWNKVMATAKEQFPSATEDELYQIATGAMNHAVGIKQRDARGVIGTQGLDMEIVLSKED